MRALAIALLYAVGTAVGGLAAPAVFGDLLLSLKEGRPGPLVTGYLFGAGLMLFAAATELVLGLATERKALEDVATPLTAEGPRPQPLPRAAAGAARAGA